MPDKFKAEITVIKRKKGEPTVIAIEGKQYTLQHKHQYRK